MNTQQERLASLIQFTKQTLLMNKRPVTSIDQHKEFVLTEEKLIDLPGISVNKNMGTEDESWLCIERLQETATPQPKDELLKIWISFPKNFSQMPVLKDKVLTSNLIDAGFNLPLKIENEDGFLKKSSEVMPAVTDHINKTTEDSIKDPDSNLGFTYLEKFSDKEKVQTALKNYIKTIWQPWLEQEKLIRRSIKLYSDLFLLSKELQGNLADAKLELVWGVGIVLWNKSDGTNIKYPLLTHLVEISLDKDTMALSVKPSAGAVKLETEPFSSQDTLDLVGLTDTFKEFFSNDDLVFNPYTLNTYSPILNTAASLLDSSGQYQTGKFDEELIENEFYHDRKLPKASDSLLITDAWVLMARPRGDNYLLQDLERFSTKLTDDQIDGSAQQIPNALSAILSEPATENQDFDLPSPSYRGISAIIGGEDNHQGKPKDLYFPKPYNDEQVRIIQMLQSFDGVVVQGPPGTGKTHTIANVICHYLALGKRVLVTSMKDPALSVLKEKLPESIQPLAVSLLNSDNESIKQFESSIRKISSEVSSIDRKQYQVAIDQLHDDIDKTHANLAQVDTDISYWGRLNLDDIVIDNETIAPLDAAKLVASKQDDIAWFPDALDITENFKPLFSNEDIAQLRDARASIKDNLIYLKETIPNLSDLPPADQIIDLHKKLISIDELVQAETEGTLPSLINDDPATIQTIKDTLLKLKTLKNQLNEVSSANVTWSQPFKQHLYNQSKQDIIDYFNVLKTDINSALINRTEFITKPITLSHHFDNNTELVDAIKNLSEGRKPFGLAGIFGKSSQKKLIEDILILGSSPKTADDWRYILTFIEFRKLSKSLITRWNALAVELSLPNIEASIDNLPNLASIIELTEIISQSVLLELEVKKTVQYLLPNWDSGTQRVYSPETLKDIERVLEQHLIKYSLVSTTAFKESLQNLLSQSTGSITRELEAFINSELGDKNFSVNDIEENWLSLTDELKHIHSLSNNFQTVRKVTELIASSGAIKWAKMLQENPISSTVISDASVSDNTPTQVAGESILPDNWREVWYLNRLISFVNRIDSRQELVALAKKRRELESNLSRLYQEVITKRTWLHLAENATPSVRGALEKYRSAIVRIGKGTGKRAPRYRKEAQDASEQASLAIPCWIMPHYRISESLPANFGSFDLVIIDEASQSDLTALPALMRAKKVLVVGDDKQVSPEGIGLQSDKIVKLMNQYLANQVELYRSQMSPERSIYDLFKVVFAGSTIMLKEHFRCAPPIIEFSKREFYDHELKPLRQPKPSERLDPPLIDVYVTDGFRTHKKTNPSEARFIVDEINKIVENKDYRGRSIGVISLLGNEQAREIMEMLSRELGEKIIQDFDIACGDARTFQGKERDIIFLSLIVDRDNAHALTRESFAQRINVAASRARDRMYLVRSIELDELSPADVYRSKLVQHFRQPFIRNEETVSHLRDKCESPFEVEIYDILVERGYKVIPQVEVGQYRIDMVVEGENDTSLAIECDGDRYHGPDKWESDIHRQRILERAGWTFWRCFASAFVLHREAVVNELIETLTQLNIHPIADAQTATNLYTETRRVQAFDEPIKTVEMSEVE